MSKFTKLAIMGIALAAMSGLFAKYGTPDPWGASMAVITEIGALVAEIAAIVEITN